MQFTNSFIEISQERKRLITKVAAKLLAEELNPVSFDRAKALEVLSRTVAPKVCIGILENYESQVVSVMYQIKNEKLK